MHILVEGEVASVTYHTSGHVYFSIKDSESSIKCVMWKSNVAKLKFRIEQGIGIAALERAGRDVVGERIEALCDGFRVVGDIP